MNVLYGHHCCLNGGFFTISVFGGFFFCDYYEDFLVWFFYMDTAFSQL